MKTLIIYNKSNGKIVFTQSINEDIENDTFTNICIEIPEGKVLKDVDVSVTPNVAILEDIPKSETEIMQEQLLATQAELANLKEQVLLSK